MSLMAVHELMERLNSDEDFRDQAVRDPEATIVGYELTDAEREALISGDPDRLAAIGIEFDSLYGGEY